MESTTQINFIFSRVRLRRNFRKEKLSAAFLQGPAVTHTQQLSSGNSRQAGVVLRQSALLKLKLKNKTTPPQTSSDTSCPSSSLNQLGLKYKVMLETINLQLIHFSASHTSEAVALITVTLDLIFNLGVLLMRGFYETVTGAHKWILRTHWAGITTNNI